MPDLPGFEELHTVFDIAREYKSLLWQKLRAERSLEYPIRKRDDIIRISRGHDPDGSERLASAS